MRSTFAVGRLDRRSREVVWLRNRPRSPLPGPWRLEAVVQTAGPVGPVETPQPSPDAAPTEPPARPEPTASPTPRRPGAQLSLF